MKRLIMKNGMAVLLLAGACCGLGACNDKDDNTPQMTPGIVAVQGEYDGEMNALQMAPTEGEAEEPAGTAVQAVVTGEAILFEDFPIRDLVIQVLGDETLADQIVEKIGQVDYAVPYTALMSEDNAGVVMTLTPEPLKLTLTNDSEGGETENVEAAAVQEIQVEIIMQTEGVYTIESGDLGFAISAASVTVDGEDLLDFEPFTLDFDMLQN